MEPVRKEVCLDQTTWKTLVGSKIILKCIINKVGGRKKDFV
jgi:hypothetical protein